MGRVPTGNSRILNLALLALDSPGLTFESHRPVLAVRVGEGFMQCAPSIDPIIGDANLLNLFEVEQPLAIRERMDRHDSDQRQGLGHIPSLCGNRAEGLTRGRSSYCLSGRR